MSNVLASGLVNLHDDILVPFPIIVRRHPDKRPLTEKGFVLAYSEFQRDSIYPGREGMVAG